MASADWPKVLDIYTKLEAQLVATKPNSPSIPIVRLRKGRALVMTGNTDDGKPALIAALDKLPLGNPSLLEDRMAAVWLIGRLSEAGFDYVDARDRFHKVAAESSGMTDKIGALLAAARVGIFVDTERALVDADAAAALIVANPTADTEFAGLARNLRGRALLNLGRTKEARKDLDAAIKLLGGLKYGKVNMLDVRARSDAAIAALRDNDNEAARKYLAYSGAAQQSASGFNMGKDMRPPACGGENGPRPEEFAVVEFSIRADGSVGGVAPVYYSGQKAAALDFARAVSQWSWNAEELKGVLPFFRNLTRIEMRCTNVFRRPDVVTMLEPSVSAWLEKSGISGMRLDEPSAARRLTALTKELASREAAPGSQPLALLPLLAEIGTNATLPFPKRVEYTERAHRLSRASNAPSTVQAYFALLYWITDRMNSNDWLSTKFQKRMKGALTDPTLSSEPEARSALAIALFDSLSPGGRNQNGPAILQPVVDDKALAPNDPYRVGALTRLANVAVAGGRLEEARSYFAQTGVSEQQCSLVDAAPAKTAGTMSDQDYPSEAIAMGFGGWTVIEFDIAADGRTQNQRPVISFPPFVFGPTGAKAISSFRYSQSFRPGGSLGCGGNQQRITFRLP